MSVITISRQLGSFGTTLGHKVASNLGYNLIHREIINQAAQLASSPELALAIIDELGLLGIKTVESDQQAYLQAVRTVINDYALRGDVIIVGRASQVILHDHDNVFHLRVVAPLETRIQRIVEAHGISELSARAQIIESDRFRAQYLKQFYSIDWNNPALYHLVINTGFLNLTDAAEVICYALRLFQDNIGQREDSIE
jgi:cytidylate kinase